MIPASHIHHLQCVLCGTTYHPAEVPYACPSCGPLGALAVHYDYEQIAPHISPAPRSCGCLCPVQPSFPSLAVTTTPSISASRPATHLAGTTAIPVTTPIL